MAVRTERYKVVVNHEEQYTILKADQSLPRGWRDVGKTGSQTDCLNYIEEVWTDMTAGDKTRILRSLGR